MISRNSSRRTHPQLRLKHFCLARRRHIARTNLLPCRSCLADIPDNGARSASCRVSVRTTQIVNGTSPCGSAHGPDRCSLVGAVAVQQAIARTHSAGNALDGPKPSISPHHFLPGDRFRACLRTYNALIAIRWISRSVCRDADLDQGVLYILFGSSFRFVLLRDFAFYILRTQILTEQR